MLAYNSEKWKVDDNSKQWTLQLQQQQKHLAR